MIYAEECLVIVADGKMTVLHRQSYYKKCVIRISDQRILKVKRMKQNDWKGLICIDNQSKIYVINVDT